MRLLMDINDVADTIGVSTKTVRRWVKAGKLIPPLPFPGKWRWTRESIAEWLEARGGETK